MKRGIGAALVAILFAGAISGCYYNRELSWTKDEIKKGETSTAKLGLGSAKDGGAPDAYVFVLVSGLSSVKVNRPVFDAKNAVGLKQKLVRDNALRDRIGEEGCYDIEGSFTVWRTATQIKPVSRKALLATLKVKAKKKGGGFLGFIAIGSWADDGDGIPEDPDAMPPDDDVYCSGITTTSMSVKGPTPSPKASIAERVRDAISD